MKETNSAEETKVFGFWVYLMTDLIIFSVLFATFAVLQNSTFGGPSGRELFSLPFALAETLILLTSSFTCALATFAISQKQKKGALLWFLITFALGLSFLVLEFSEFAHFASRGATPQRSGFLSAYFTLVGTHGLHISVGLLWMFVMMLRIGKARFEPPLVSQLLRLALFWHFLDIVWVFIFTAVYASGHLL